MIGCYVRVSTEEQNLDRQMKIVTDYAKGEFNVDLGDVEIYRDKSTGTNTDRSGYRSMMADAESGDIDVVVVPSITRVSRSIRDLERTAERLRGADTELHIVGEGLRILPDDDDPFQRAMFQLLGVFAEFEAKITQQRVRDGIAARQSDEDYHHGPAPLGFEKDDGELVEGENYDQVCTVLEMKAKGEMGTREASRELGCGTATVNRAIEDRPELYGL